MMSRGSSNSLPEPEAYPERSKNLRSASLGFGHRPVYYKSILHTHSRQEVDPLDVDTDVLIDQLPTCLRSSLGHGVLTFITTISFKFFESRAPSIEVEHDQVSLVLY